MVYTRLILEAILHVNSHARGNASENTAEDSSESRHGHLLTIKAEIENFRANEYSVENQ